MITKLSQLIEGGMAVGKKRMAVAQGADVDLLKAVIEAEELGIIEPVLVGDRATVEAMLNGLGCTKDFHIVQGDTDEDCAFKAVELVRQGGADFLMKGLLATRTLMSQVVKSETGLRTGKTISHTMFYQTENYHKLLCITDGGMNTFPSLEKKADILENALEVCNKLGISNPVCACVCGAEVVDQKVQSTLDAQSLVGMTERFAPYNACVIGPVGLDLAISHTACEHKDYKAQGGGEADILLVPTYEVGNGIGKAMTYFGGAISAGIVVGAAVPIVLVSRADTPEVKLLSIALAAVVAG